MSTENLFSKAEMWRGGVLEMVQLIGNLWEVLFREDQDMTAQNMKKRFQT